MKGGGQKTPDPDWARGRSGRSTANSRQNSPPRETPPTIRETPPARSRRGSRVARQHSYDDEVKPSLTTTTTPEPGKKIVEKVVRDAIVVYILNFNFNLAILPLKICNQNFTLNMVQYRFFNFCDRTT